MAFSFRESWLARQLHTPLVMLLTLPAGIAFALWAVAPILALLERGYLDNPYAILGFSFDPDTARNVLAVVAGGAITALSLTYSLVLVVFTLAAGNIGPRLLKRFTSEPVNQVTAGIFGGTFLYCLGVMAFIEPGFAPTFATLGAGVLALVSVLQLIYFVRHVSTSVMIDDEIAQIAKRLTLALEAHRESYQKLDDKLSIDSFDVDLKAPRGGYVGQCDEVQLITVAAAAGVVVKLTVAPGEFVLEGDVIATVSKSVDEETEEKLVGLLAIDSARSAEREIEFSIDLLVEIALRALSPGVNDAYTAIAAADSLSAALSDVAGVEAAPTGRCDEEGEPRLIVPGLAFDQLTARAFHPLRRASANNVLVAQAIARALTRMYLSGNDAARETVKQHADLLREELSKANHLAVDVQSIDDLLPRDVRAKPSDDDEAKS